MMLRKNKNVLLSIDEIVMESLVSFNDEQWEFFEVISELKEKEKKILTLRYYYQMSIEEISHVLCVPLSTVKSRLYRTLEDLKIDWSELDEFKCIG